MTRIALRPVLAAAALAATVQGAFAAPVSVVFPYNFRDNNFGIVPGPARDIILFGAFQVTPGPTGGTTGTFIQGDMISGGSVSGALLDRQFSGAPRLFENDVPYSPGLTGAWTLAFTNELNSTVVTTPYLGNVGSMPLASNVNLTANGGTPIVTWELPATPAGVRIDQAQVFVFERLSATTFDLIHLGPYVDPASGMYQVPENLVADPGYASKPYVTMETGKTYIVSVNLVQLDAQNGIETRSLYALDYALQPIPEPSTTLLLGAGLGIVAAAASVRRRKA